MGIVGEIVIKALTLTGDAYNACDCAVRVLGTAKLKAFGI